MDEELREKILKLKEAKNAVILAHNYQIGPVQDIADFTGDSLALSRQAARVDKAMIVFCGVFFMAETAKILSPEKKVILPDLAAGCPMADMITAAQLRAFKEQYPGSPVVCYVNSTAEVKAESDICCTSSNAVKVVNSIPKDKRILFVPDKFLGGFVRQKTGRDIVAWQGYCPTHAKLTREMVAAAKAARPKARVLVHPECPAEVIDEAHEALSTGQMLKYVGSSAEQEFIIGTEKGLLHQLQKQNPGKRFYLVSKDLICPNMKRITLRKLARALETEKEEIRVPAGIAGKAVDAIQRMLDLPD